MIDKLEQLLGVLETGPEQSFAVVPVPSLPVFAEEFHLPASVNSEHLRGAISSGLPIVLAAQIDPTTEATAAGLQPFAVRAEVFFRGPERNGKVAVVFETQDKVSVRYSESGGNIRATARGKDFWSI